MNHTLTHTHTTLGMCLFSEEDDLSYLSNDVTWIDSRGERLKSHEKGALTALVQRLRRMESGMITSRFAKKILEDYFNKDEIKELIQEERRTELRNLFQAAIVRELILREEDETSMIQRRGQFLSLYPFLVNQEGTSLELTWLNRFERAMRFLLRVLPAQGHKISFINIAAHLQGSDIFTEYVTGGANRPETQRRVDLFEAITAVKPLVRAPRVLKKKLAGAGSNGVNSDGEKKRGRGRPRKTEGEKKANYTKKSNQSHRKNSFSSESSFDSSSEQQVTFMTTLDACSTDDNSDSEESSLDEIDAVKFFNESFGYEINSFLPPAPSSSNYVTSPLPVSLPASESFLLPASSYYPYDANLVYSYQSDSNDDDTSLDQLTQMLESEEEELSMNDREEEILMYGQEDLMVN